MIKINTYLFTLDEVYSTISYSDTITNLEFFNELKIQFLNQLNELHDDLSFNLDKENMINSIYQQMVYLNQNIKTFENALLCRETNVYEMRTISSVLTKIWLN